MLLMIPQFIALHRGCLISEKTMLWNLIIPLWRKPGTCKTPKKQIGNDAWKLQDIGINLRVPYFFGYKESSSPVDMVNPMNCDVFSWNQVVEIPDNQQ